MELYRDVSLDVLIAHLRHAAREAILVQDACNLSGVVHSFSRVMSLLSEVSNRQRRGTDWKNHHPIAVLYANKIASLTGAETAVVFSKAYTRCQKISDPESPELGWE